MKNLLVLLILLPVFVNAQYKQTTINGQNAAVQTPEGYAISGKKYTCVVFFQGIGEVGSDWNLMYRNGIGYYMKAGKLNYDAIFIAIQQKPDWPTPTQVEKTLQEIYAKYPVDSFALTGLSAGSFTIIWYMGEKKSSLPIRALVPMSFGTKDYATYNTAAYKGVKTWGLSGTTDSRTYNMKATMAKIAKDGYSVRTTWYNGGHCCWNTYYNPAWKENGISLYDFMIGTPSVVPPDNAPKPGDIIKGEVIKVNADGTFTVKYLP